MIEDIRTMAQEKLARCHRALPLDLINYLSNTASAPDALRSNSPLVVTETFNRLSLGSDVVAAFEMAGADPTRLAPGWLRAASQALGGKPPAQLIREDPRGQGAQVPMRAGMEAAGLQEADQALDAMDLDELIEQAASEGLYVCIIPGAKRTPEGDQMLADQLREELRRARSGMPPATLAGSLRSITNSLFGRK